MTKRLTDDEIKVP